MSVSYLGNLTVGTGCPSVRLAKILISAVTCRCCVMVAHSIPGFAWERTDRPSGPVDGTRRHGRVVVGVEHHHCCVGYEEMVCCCVEHTAMAQILAQTSCACNRGCSTLRCRIVRDALPGTNARTPGPRLLMSVDPRHSDPEKSIMSMLSPGLGKLMK